jgi:hypothetical protein
LYTAAGFTAATALCNNLIHYSPAAYAHLIPSEEFNFKELTEGDEDMIPELQNGSPLEPHNTSTALLPNLDNTDTSTSSPSEWLNMNFQDEASPPEDQQAESQPPSPQNLWTYWHQRLGHLSKVRMQAMAIEGRLPKQLATCEVPLCPSCIAGKSTRRPWRSKGKPSKVTKSITAPGQWVHVDQLESPTPGFIGQMKSPNLTTHRYRVATIFVDSYSDFTFIWNQTSTNAEQTLGAKQAFERFASANNVHIHHYHADNGRFAEPTFVNEINSKGQAISFSGVGAHHQNGVAERRIRDLQDSARAMLIHAYRRWPNAISVNLWPYALRNATTNEKGKKTPVAAFARVEREPKLTLFHPFGYPVYVLDARMQSRQKIPKWEERTRIGINLCMSPSHAQSVTLVLNLLTGLVSPQYHVLHDDRFETVCDALIPKSKWQQLAKLQPNTPQPSKVSEGDGLLPDQHLHFFQHPLQELDANLDLNLTSDDIQTSEGAPETEDHTEEDQPINEQLQTLRRSRRIRKPSLRLRESQETRDIFLQSTVHSTVAFEVQVLTNTLEELYIDQVHPIAFAASSDPDTLYLHEAMKQPDADQFIKAMAEEIQAHEDNHHWEVVIRDVIPHGTPILPAIWSMRRKRRIDTRAIYKWKARLTIHGGKQEHGINYWETFSPVVRWSTIRLTFILAIKYQWATRQLDFVLAYPQAPVECDLYMEVPRGHQLYDERKQYAIKLKQNLYGQKQAGRVWNKYLTTTLTKNGFLQSQVDECLFYFKQCIILIYVDDTIIAGPTNNNVNEVVNILSSLFKIEDQGNISDYLGVQVKQLKDGSFSLAQPHLIDAILHDMHFQPNTPT